MTIAQIEAIRAKAQTSETVVDCIEEFKAVIKPFVPTLAEVLASREVANRVVTNNQVTAIYDTAIIDMYIAKIGASWATVIYDELSAAIQIFSDDNDAYYYSEEKHNFFVFMALEQAAKAGKKVAVMENLS